MTKEQLRKTHLALRAKLSHRETASKAIAARLFESPFYASAKTVMTYLSYKSEPDTFEIINRMLKDGKTVCVPVCYAGGRMEAFAICDTEDLAPSPLGILEPPRDVLVAPEEIDLCLVPGCCFNSLGHRIGYGGGFYDRYLKDFGGTTCGLFYDCLETEFTAEEKDVPLHYIITEKRCLKF